MAHYAEQYVRARIAALDDQSPAVYEGRRAARPHPPKAQALLAGDAPTDSDGSETRGLVAARARRLSTNAAFLARLWARDVKDEAFFGIVYTTAQGTVYEHQELEIDSEVAATWLRIAGAKMYACREIMGPKGNPDWEKKRGCLGEERRNLGRRGWEVAKGSWRSNVIETAQAALDVMEKVEHETHSQ